MKWDDILLGHADQLAPKAVVSPLVDSAIVDAALTAIVQPMQAGRWPYAYTAEIATQYIQGRVAHYRAEREAEAAMVAEWSAPGAPHAHQVAARLMREAS